MVTMKYPLMEHARRMLAHWGLFWTHEAELPLSLVARSQNYPDPTLPAGRFFSARKRDELIEASQGIYLEIEEELEEGASDPGATILALRECLLRQANAPHIDPYLATISEWGFFGDNMRKYSPATFRFAQINMRGCLIGVTDGAAFRTMRRIVSYASGMRISVVGLSEVDCKNLDRVKKLQHAARELGYQLFVPISDHNGGSAAILWVDGLKVEDTISLAGGRVAQGRFLSPAGPILLLSVYGPTGGSNANASLDVTTAENQMGDCIGASVAAARYAGDSIVLLGDLNSIAGSLDSVHTDSVERGDSLVSRLIHRARLTDTFRQLHPNEAALTHPPRTDPNRPVGSWGNRLDYILTSCQSGTDTCTLRVLKAGIHKYLGGLDHYPYIVDALLDRVDHPLGRHTGELTQRLKVRSFLHDYTARDPAFMIKFDRALASMFFSPQNAEEYCALLGAESHRATIEGIVSEGMHLLVHATLELVRDVSGRASGPSRVKTASDVEIALLQMVNDCNTFNAVAPGEEEAHAIFWVGVEETLEEIDLRRSAALSGLSAVQQGQHATEEAAAAKRAHARASSLKRALAGWSGRGIHVGVKGGGKRDGGWMRYDVMRDLDHFIKHEKVRFSARMQEYLGTIRSDCLAALSVLQQASLVAHEERMQQALMDNDMGAFFRLLNGLDTSPRNVPPPAGGHLSRSTYRKSVDDAAAVLRRAGLDRPLPPFVSRIMDPILGGYTFMPSQSISGPTAPSADDIARVLGMSVESLDPDTLSFVRCLWLRGTRGVHQEYDSSRNQSAFESLTRPTDEDEIRTVTRGWISKAPGITEFRIGLVFCLPPPYIRLFIALINAQLERGVVPRSMCNGLLAQLKKPDGGHRGLFLSEDVLKLIASICIHRLTSALRALPLGALTSKDNSAYARGRGVEEVHLALDLFSCKARWRRLRAIILEYDLYKYFDQILRSWLMALLVLFGLASFAVVLGRRYQFQRLISDTICGLTGGIVRGPCGIDQGGSDSPIFSQVYQTPFLDALRQRMQEIYVAGFLLQAFADNHWVGWIVPAGMMGVFSPLNIINTLLRLNEMVVKPSSVRRRDITVRGEDTPVVEVGTLKTRDHITGEEVEVFPPAVAARDHPTVLGIPFSGSGSFATGGGIFVRNMSYHLHGCTSRNVCLQFLEVTLRAHVYARSQYGAAFRVMEWADIKKLAQRVNYYRRARLGLAPWANLSIAYLPSRQGGLSVSLFHLEGFVIPWTRSVLHLLNLDTDLGTETREYVTTPDADRLSEPGARLQLETAMRRLAPYGILFFSVRHQIACRAIAIVQGTLAGAAHSVRPLAPLSDCVPTDTPTRHTLLEDTHKIFTLGGPLFNVLAHLMPAIRPVLDNMGQTALTSTVANEIEAILRVSAPSSPGYIHLGNYWSDAEWRAVAHALVSARRESDYDIALQRQAAGLPPTEARFWPDWTGDDCPIIMMLDDTAPHGAEAVGQLAHGQSILAASDGSATMEPGENGAPSPTSQAGWALAAYAVNADDPDALILGRPMFAMSAPFPVRQGISETSSADTELMALLMMFRVFGRDAWAHAHAVLDSTPTLDSLLRLISAEVPGAIDPTPREIRSWNCYPLWQRLIRLLRRLPFGRLDWNTVHLGEGGANRMWQAVKRWKTTNKSDGPVHRLWPLHVGWGSFSWIKSHQPKQDNGPAPAAVKANEEADKLATKGAQTRFVQPANYGPTPGRVRIPAGTSEIRVLFRGDAMDRDVGDALRKLAWNDLNADLRRPPAAAGTSGATWRVVTGRWGPLASPDAFRRVRVRDRVVDIRESMFATQLGYYGHIDKNDQHVDRKCVLCQTVCAKYSTSHALRDCTHPTLVTLRTAMLKEVDGMLHASDIRCATALLVGLEPGGNNDNTAIEPGVSQTLTALQHAGHFLLNGNIEALRGVPLTRIAEWMMCTGLDAKGDKVSRDMVAGLLKAVTALIIVDGQHILDRYKALVEAARPPVAPQEAARANPPVAAAGGLDNWLVRSSA